MTCGEGVQTRLVNCTGNGTVIDDIFCLENTPGPKPAEERVCQGPLCKGIWVVQNWINHVSTTIWLCIPNYLLYSVYHPVVMEKVYSLELYFVCTMDQLLISTTTLSVIQQQISHLVQEHVTRLKNASQNGVKLSGAQ